MGPTLTLWSSAGVRDAWRRSEELLRLAPLPQVELHSWPDSADDEFVVKEATKLGMRVSFGVGMDGFARDVKRGALVFPTAKKVRKLYEKAADLAAVELNLDPEGWYKTQPGTVERVRIHDFILAVQDELMDGVAKRGMPVGLTTYDQPGLHASDFPWTEWLGDVSAGVEPITTFWPQVYAGTSGVMANTDSLERREERSLASIAVMVRKGRIRSDLKVLPYLQGHHVPAVSTVREAIEHESVKVWASPTRIDDQGRLTVRCLSWVWKHGLWGKPVSELQKVLGVTPDGKFGPRSFSALLAAVG